MTPLAILLERAEVAMLTHGSAAQDEMLRQIASAIRNDDDPGKVRDLDHVLQLVEYRERIAGARPGRPRDDVRTRDIPVPGLSAGRPGY